MGIATQYVHTWCLHMHATNKTTTTLAKPSLAASRMKSRPVEGVTTSAHEAAVSKNARSLLHLLVSICYQSVSLTARSSLAMVFGLGSRCPLCLSSARTCNNLLSSARCSACCSRGPQRANFDVQKQIISGCIPKSRLSSAPLMDMRGST